jgi:FKBP-type peptidyl-prolyl cis-trans isomerase FkpA
MTSTSGLRRFAPLGLLLLAATAGCDFGKASSTPTSPDQSNVAYSQTDLTVGTGDEATTGKAVTVQFGGWLYSDAAPDHKGQQFAADTAAFTIGDGTVIQGFDRAVTGMRVGGTRRAIIPPSLAFGATGSSNGSVPPNAAIVVDIALTNVVSPSS